jgi:hypothetical protein
LLLLCLALPPGAGAEANARLTCYEGTRMSPRCANTDCLSAGAQPESKACVSNENDLCLSYQFKYKAKTNGVLTGWVYGVSDGKCSVRSVVDCDVMKNMTRNVYNQDGEFLESSWACQETATRNGNSILAAPVGTAPQGKGGASTLVPMLSVAVLSLAFSAATLH